jgi:aquaporin Z
VLFIIASGKPGFDLAAGSRRTATPINSPGGYSLLAGFVAEVVMTAMFHGHHHGGDVAQGSCRFAPIAHRPRPDPDPLVSIPVTKHLW